MKVYRGIRKETGELAVTVNEKTLDPRLDLWNHSPTGFECGYVGSGPAQLALAILADHLGDDKKAVALHQQFKWALIANLPRERGWRLTESNVAKVVQAILKKEALS